MKLKLYIALFLFLCCKISAAQDWKVFPYQPPGSRVSFPKDEGRHINEPVEWWYISGHAKGKTTGKDYSFMISYFYYPALGYDGFRILNITDEATGAFLQETRPLHYTALATDHLDIQADVASRGKEYWTNKKDANGKLIPYEYDISAASAAAALNLQCVATKRPLVLSEDGYLEQGISNYTYYYSQTRNVVSGNITVNNVTEAIEGIAWIDRQYGDFNPYFGERYEWFHLQLSNGMDINLWNIFDTANAIPNNSRYRILSAWVSDGEQYTTDAFTIERLGYNWMADSGMCYADKWRVTSEKNKIDVVMTTRNKTTEVQLPFRFFEGATTITGTVDGKAVTGNGFAELLHSYQHPRVSITYPATAIYDNTQPITWQVNDPDDGRPLQFDIAYSIGNDHSFVSLAENISDTFFLWKDAAVQNGDRIWFKITAHSDDGNLSGVQISKQAATVQLKQTAGAAVKWFPNPADNYLFANPGWQRDNPAGSIVDAQGRTVLSIKKNSLDDKIAIGNLQRGLYLLVIDYPSGPVSWKFIKM